MRMDYQPIEDPKERDCSVDKFIWKEGDITLESSPWDLTLTDGETTQLVTNIQQLRAYATRNETYPEELIDALVANGKLAYAPVRLLEELRALGLIEFEVNTVHLS